MSYPTLRLQLLPVKDVHRPTLISDLKAQVLVMKVPIRAIMAPALAMKGQAHIMRDPAPVMRSTAHAMRT